MNVTELLLNQMKQRPESLAVRLRGKDLTYASLGILLLKVANVFEDAGIGIGDVVAVNLDDPLDHFLATLAIAHRGAVALSIPDTMSVTLQARLLSMTQCSKVVTEDISNQRWQIPLINWGLATHHTSPMLTLPAVDRPDQPWIYVTGSGSTGRPKIMPVTHRQQVARSSLAKDWLPYDSSDVLLSLVSMHFYAAKQRYLEAISLGAAIFLDTPGRIDYREEVANRKITAIYGTVSHIESLLHSLPKAPTRCYEDLRALMVGGSSVSMMLRAKIKQHITSRFYVLWGANECHTASITRLSEVFVTPGGVGRPLPGFNIEVVDHHLNPVLPGVDGLIRIISTTNINGYLGDKKASDKAFRGGWFYPGDIGHLTLDGQLVHRGRSDDMMIVSGVNVYPAEIEECLRSHSGVADVLATPLRHPQVQDLPVALVVAKSVQSLNPKMLLEYVRNQIGRHTLYDLIFVERIPRNEQGKIQREAVSEILRAKWGQFSRTDKSNFKSLTPLGHTSTSKFNVEFKLPPDIKSGALRAWLMLMDDQLLSFSSNDSSEGDANDGKTWLREVLALVLGLFHVIRIPLFVPIEILKCERPLAPAQNWHGVCRSPDSSLVPARLLEGLVNVAFKLATWASEADVESQADRERFFQVIDKDVLRAFSKLKPNGKSTFEILRVAHRLGIPTVALPGGVFQLGWGSHARRIDRSTTDQDSNMGMRWTQNKLLTAQLLRAAGLPGPVHTNVSSIEQARQVANRIGFPVVVKPADLERGEGVSVDVHPEDLEAAFSDAYKRSPGKMVLVEQQISGVCHRIFIAAGKLLYAVKRLPIGLYADGVSTIRKLVDAEWSAQQYIPPWKRSGILALDDIAIKMLHSQGWVPESIPEAGKFVALRRIETTAWGGVDEEYTHSIHPHNISAAIAATKLFGLEVAGVDMISLDITQPWYSNSAIINEVNYAPLLGGGEISRRYIEEYLSRILKGDGRIAIEVFIGGSAAWHAAQKRWRMLRESEVDAWLVSQDHCLAADGKDCPLIFNRVGEKVSALLMRQDVDALLLVVQTTEFLLQKLPFDFITKLEVLDNQISDESQLSQRASSNQFAALIDLFKKCLL